MAKLSNTKAVQTLVHDIQNLCRYDDIYCKEREGYIFVQLSSVGHSHIRLYFHRHQGVWYMVHTMGGVSCRGDYRYVYTSTEDIIDYIRNH